MANDGLSLDVIIPCYNAANTVRRAVMSALAQSCVRRVYLIDDGSSDGSWQVLQSLKADFGDKIHLEKRHQNGGAALARNVGAILSDADMIAFLDADDSYEDGALDIALMAMTNIPNLALVRLRLQPINFPERYTAHSDFARAWQQLAMTVAGNTIFRRSLFLACGGFPSDDLFRRLGGEDGALGLALVANTVVGTLFDERVPAVNHHYRAGIHGARLLDALLFGHLTNITQADLDYANQVTACIGRRLQHTLQLLAVPQTGVMALQVS